MQSCGFQAMRPSQFWGYPQNPQMNERERAIQEHIFNLLKQIQEDVKNGSCDVNLSEREIQILNTLTRENAVDMWFSYLQSQYDAVEKLQIQIQNSSKETAELKRNIGTAKQEQNRLKEDTKTTDQQLKMVRQEQNRLKEDTKTTDQQLEMVRQEQNKLKEDMKTTDQQLKMVRQEQNKLKEDMKTTDQQLKMLRQADNKLGKKIDFVSQELGRLEKRIDCVRQEHVEMKKNHEEEERVANELRKAIQRMNEEREKENNRGFFCSLFHNILDFFSWLFGI